MEPFFLLPGLAYAPWDLTPKPVFHFLKVPTALSLARMAGPFWFFPNATKHSSFTPLSDTSFAETKQIHPPCLGHWRGSPRGCNCWLTRELALESQRPLAALVLVPGLEVPPATPTVRTMPRTQVRAGDHVDRVCDGRREDLLGSWAGQRCTRPVVPKTSYVRKDPVYENCHPPVWSGLPLSPVSPGPPSMGPVCEQTLALYLDPWFLTGGTLPPGATGQHMEAALVVTMGGGASGMECGSQGCCWAPHSAQNGPHHREGSNSSQDKKPGLGQREGFWLRVFAGCTAATAPLPTRSCSPSLLINTSIQARFDRIYSTSAWRLGCSGTFIYPVLEIMDHMEDLQPHFKVCSLKPAGKCTGEVAMPAFEGPRTQAQVPPHLAQHFGLDHHTEHTVIKHVGGWFPALGNDSERPHPSTPPTLQSGAALMTVDSSFSFILFSHGQHFFATN